LDVSSNRTPVFVGAGPVSVGAGSGGGGEEIATNVLATPGPGGRLVAAGGPELTAGTLGEDAGALVGASGGLPARFGLRSATARHVTPASTAAVATAITSQRGGRGHFAGS